MTGIWIVGYRWGSDSRLPLTGFIFSRSVLRGMGQRVPHLIGTWEAMGNSSWQVPREDKQVSRRWSHTSAYGPRLRWCPRRFMRCSTRTQISCLSSFCLRCLCTVAWAPEQSCSPTISNQKGWKFIGRICKLRDRFEKYMLWFCGCSHLSMSSFRSKYHCEIVYLCTITIRIKKTPITWNQNF